MRAIVADCGFAVLMRRDALGAVDFLAVYVDVGAGSFVALSGEGWAGAQDGDDRERDEFHVCLPISATRLAWSGYDSSAQPRPTLTLRQGKSSRRGVQAPLIVIPCTPALSRVLNETPRDGLLILTTKTGQSFKRRYFAELWDRTAKAAGGTLWAALTATSCQPQRRRADPCISGRGGNTGGVSFAMGLDRRISA